MKAAKLSLNTGTILLLSSGAFFLLYLFLYFSGSSVWDDAYIFSRYGDNLSHSGVLSWNPGETPSYGLTSQLHLIPVVLFQFLSSSPAAALYLASLFSGLALLGLLYLLLRSYGARYSRHPQVPLWYGTILLGMNAPLLAQHFSSGMDTCLALLWVTAYLLLFKRFEKSLSPGKALILGLLGGLAWLVRPDLLIFAIVLPASLVIFSRRKITRIQGLYTLLFTAFTVLCIMLAAGQYYGSVLPLSFFVKSGNPYGPSLAETYRWVPFAQLGLFLLHNLLPLLGVMLALRFTRKYWRINFSLTDKALLIASFVFVVYYLCFVLQIMGYGARFFFPLFPIFAYLGLRSWSLLLEARPDWRLWLQKQLKKGISMPITGVYLLFLLAILFGHRYPDNFTAKLGRFSTEANYSNLGQHNWPYLDRFSKLRDDLVIGSTEIGIPGAMNPQKQVIDLAGLTDKEFAMSGAKVVTVLQKHQPDLLYMPHPDYKEMNEQLVNSDFFKDAYQYYPAEQLQSFLGIAILKPGHRSGDKHFYSLKYIIEEELAKQP